jgi:hypothetical protein
MGQVVNLNRFRKLKAKAEAAKRADTNRRQHGRTKAERTRDEHKKRLLDAKLDGARLELVTERRDGDDEST